MSALRAKLQAALLIIGGLLAGVGAWMAASIDVPAGGGDIPTGFAVLFSWAIVAIGVAVLSLGLVLLDETGVGSVLSRTQRRLVQGGGVLLLLAAVAPVAGVLLLPVLYGLLGPGSAGEPNTILSTLLVGWLGVIALGGLAILGGVGWRLVEASTDAMDASGLP
jgi:hypothetical protein